MNLDELKKLHHRKYREQYGFFLAEGEHLVLELGKAVARRPQLATARIFATHEYLAGELPAAFPRQLDLETLAPRQMAQLTETRTPQGVVALVPILAPPPPAATERAIYLHEIQDPGNLGTILRTLAWFGGFRCLLSPDSVDPYNSKAVRASMGALFSVPFETGIDWATLTRRYPRRALLDLHGQAIGSAEFAAFDCYLFGNEARGPSAQMRAQNGDAVFSIPGGAGMESLNLAATVNICVYELARRSNGSGNDTTEGTCS